MSQENVEALRAAMDAFNRRDGEAFGAFLGEDAEIVPVRAVVDAGDASEAGGAEVAL